MPWLWIISVALLGYAYAGYPVLIWLLARGRGRPARKGRFEGGVSVLIAAHDEAEALPRKLGNLLELAKIEPVREIWIGLDGCTDGTAKAIRERIQNSEVRIQNGTPTTNDQQPPQISNIQYPISNLQGRHIPKMDLRGRANRPGEPVVYLLEFSQRRGKAAVLNDLMANAKQPILVMMDARQRVEPGAISKLLENFADPQVGVVSGALVYEAATGGAQKGAESYWGYEKFIRRCESRFWAVPGATGAFYAIRRELCHPIPEKTLVDDVLIPMLAVLEGFRCLFEPAALVFDLPTTRFSQEGLRKRRTLAGIWQIGGLEPKIYSIWANPIWFQWISHKFLRLLTPFFILAALVSTGMMESWNDGMIGRAGIIFWGILGMLTLSGLAYWGGRGIQSRVLGLLGAFWGVNWALLLAAWDAGTGRFEAQWKQTHSSQ